MSTCDSLLRCGGGKALKFALGAQTASKGSKMVTVTAQRMSSDPLGGILKPGVTDPQPVSSQLLLMPGIPMMRPEPLRTSPTLPALRTRIPSMLPRCNAPQRLPLTKPRTTMHTVEGPCSERGRHTEDRKVAGHRQKTKHVGSTMVNGCCTWCTSAAP